MFRKRCKKGKGKLNKIPLNILQKSKGQRRTRPRVSKELITVHRAFHDYQNSKDLPEEKDIPEEKDDAAYYEGIDYHDDSLPAGDSYYKQKKKAAENWEEVRAGVQKIILHRHLVNKDSVCFHCKQNAGVVRCHQCSPAMNFTRTKVFIILQKYGRYNNYMYMEYVCFYNITRMIALFH